MDLLERVYNTQFRSLFTAPVLQFLGTIVHHMLMRRVSSNSKEITFMVNGHELIFGMKEYALVTGLYFCSFPELNEEEFRGCPPLSVKYFKGKNSVRMSELETAFLKCKDKEDAFKMGKNTLIEVKSALKTTDVTEMEESSMEKRLYSGEEFEEMDETTDVFFLRYLLKGRKRKVEGTLKEVVNLKRKLAYVLSPTRIPTPPTATSSPRTPSVGVGCKCDELKEEVKEMKIELKEELKVLKTEIIKELKITNKETQQTHLDSMKMMVKDPKEEFEEKKSKVDQNVEKNEVKNPKDVKVEEFEEEESKVDQNVEETEVKYPKDVKVEEFKEECKVVDQKEESKVVVEQKEESKVVVEKKEESKVVVEQKEESNIVVEQKE
ncbi:uncharacterized protein LOC124943432 [Impatiens glandulifera]|uniref:uncharacterized protein LOC124943432 n=1 Tax=Impatiens glandulifera TaxID=253017 RepID=UPI001FB0DDF3|nr:uncharacterized protein LOC124943432 [Impatiens glandulifera]